MKKHYKEIDYKGRAILYNFYRRNEYTVEWNGDDLVFDSEEKAKEFIDGMTVACCLR